MTLREWCDAWDRGDWGDMHVLFLERIAPQLLRRLWDRAVERAGIVLQAADLPPDMAVHALPEPEPPQPLPTWAYVYKALRDMGQNPETLTLEEALLYLQTLYEYDADKQDF